ncbi:MAG: hypothetical protein KG075_21900 [Alphaproteobacteria bacterium]|nr:hypothetical protein [Alphaproteobacteria bacterium]
MTTDLIKRLTEAGEGSRELDCAFGISIGRFVEEPERFPGGGARYRDVVRNAMPGQAGDMLVPHYTTNLQDAVSAMPEGWGIAQLTQMDPTLKHSPHFCELRPFNGNDTEWARVSGHLPSGMSRASMAVATCIAILRALETKDE